MWACTARKPGPWASRPQRSHGGEIRYDVHEGEGHMFGRRENRIKALDDAGKFLLDHLFRDGADAKLAPVPEAASTMSKRSPWACSESDEHRWASSGLRRGGVGPADTRLRLQRSRAPRASPTRQLISVGKMPPGCDPPPGQAATEHQSYLRGRMRTHFTTDQITSPPNLRRWLNPRRSARRMTKGRIDLRGHAWSRRRRGPGDPPERRTLGPWERRPPGRC